MAVKGFAVVNTYVTIEESWERELLAESGERFDGERLYRNVVVAIDSETGPRIPTPRERRQYTKFRFGI